MLKRGTVIVLLLCCSAAWSAEPDPAGFVPAEAVALISVKDIRPMIPAAVEILEFFEQPQAQTLRVFLQQLGQVINGRLSVAIIPPAGENIETAFLLRVPVDESKINLDQLLVRTLQQAVGAENVEHDVFGGVRQLKSKRGRGRLCWLVKDKTLHASNVRMYVSRILDPSPKPVKTLLRTEAYERLGKHVNWRGDVAAYFNIKDTIWADAEARMKPPEAGGGLRPRQAMFKWLAPDELTAAGLSWTGDGRTGSGRLAVLADPARKGLYHAAGFANGPMQNLDQVPENVQLLIAGQGLIDGLVGRVSKLMAELDPEVGKEFADEAAAFSKELGVDLDKDLIGNLRSFAGAVRLPGSGMLAVYNVFSMRDPAAFHKAVEALVKYDQRRLRQIVRQGQTYHILPGKPATGYTFRDKRMYFSNTFEAVEEMLALKPGGKTLANAEAFAKLRQRLPKESLLTVAVDLEWLSRFATTVLSWAGPKAQSKVSAKELNRFLEQFQQAGPGLSLGLAFRDEPGAFVVHLESLAGDLWKMLPEMMRLLHPAIKAKIVVKRKP